MGLPVACGIAASVVCQRPVGLQVLGDFQVSVDRKEMQLISAVRSREIGGIESEITSCASPEHEANRDCGNPS